jgi:hypothetical protein
MPLTSDITLNAGKFNPASNPEQSKQLNIQLIEKLGGGPKWFEVGVLSFH